MPIDCCLAKRGADRFDCHAGRAGGNELRRSHYSGGIAAVYRQGAKTRSNRQNRRRAAVGGLERRGNWPFGKAFAGEEVTRIDIAWPATLLAANAAAVS